MATFPSITPQYSTQETVKQENNADDSDNFNDMDDKNDS